MKRLALLVIVCIAAIASVAFADARHRLVVVADDARLVHAIEAALQPWDIEVVTVLQSAPAGENDAAEIAKREQADGVAWTTSAAIWLYEPRGPRMVSREIAQVDHYDEASAAAVALSLKTLIRMGSLSPDAPARSVAAPWETASVPVPSSSAPSKPIPILLPMPKRRPRGDVAIEIGARLFETDAQIAEPRLAVAGGLWIDHFGLELALNAGTGASVSRAGLNGSFYDFGASLLARAAFETGRIRWMPGAGVGAHLAWLSASVATGPAEVVRLDPAIELELFVAYTLAPRVWLGLRAGAAIFLRRQQVFVDDVPAITFAPVMLDLGLRGAFAF